jgi:hypothetical protein
LVQARTSSLPGESRLLYLDSVPAGFTPEILFRSLNPDSAGQTKRIRISKGVPVAPGDTVPASAFQEWSHSARIFLNSTASGANVLTGPSYGFPVPVRLGPGAAVFSGASEDGHDVRFAKADGQPLRFEIESWDSKAAEALIWVRVDTVRPNDSGQFMRMYWGNPAAPALVQSPVFDTAAGFQSVWHMESQREGNPPTMRDACQTGNDLSLSGIAGSDQAPSPLGKGVSLSGDSTMLFTSKAFTPPQVFTISVWFRTTTTQGGKLIGFGEDPLMVDTSRDRHIWMDTVGKVHFGVHPNSGSKQGFEILNSAASLNDGRWHLVAGVLWSGGQVLYVDGNKAGEDASVTSAQWYGKGYWKLGFDFKFWDWAFAPSALHFQGELDEARVTTRALSKEWFKLAYESQRSDSRFLRFDNP